jgi:hypothetical protein
MVPVDGDSLEEALSMMRRARGLQALEAVRREARRKGLDRLPMKKIDALIARERQARRRRLGG